MKVLINAYSARLGGGQTYLKNLMAYMPDNMGLEVLVYAPKELDLPEYKCIRRCNSSWPTTNPLLRTIWEKMVLPFILYREKVQVLFCPGGVVSTRVPSQCKTVTMFRNMLPFDERVLARLPFGLQKIRNIILKPVMLRSMKNADLTIFISEHARSIIQSLVEIKHPITIPHGINSAFMTQGKSIARPVWLPEQEYLLYVSRFDVYKHQFEVVTAYAALKPEIRKRYKLLLVGEADNELSRRVIDLAKQKGIDNMVIIAGPVEYAELPNVYHHASINLFASSCENCPNILLEALAAGRPVLSSNVMPMPEFGGDAVAYFDPTIPGSIQEVMQRVLQNEIERASLSRAAARRSKNYDWSKTALETWSQMSKLVTE
jgi:glycosyltransferase involved in cell wall biosynthesis